MSSNLTRLATPRLGHLDSSRSTLNSVLNKLFSTTSSTHQQKPQEGNKQHHPQEEVRQMHQQDEDDDDEEEKEEEEDDDDDDETVNKETGEINGPRGPEPTRYGDWERNGRCYDF